MAIQVGERSNPAVQACLDRLAEGVVARVAHGSTVEAALSPFLADVRRGDGTTSDAGSLDAKVFHDADRWLVDVRMGFASSVSAFDLSGKRLALPAKLRWSYREFGSFFRTGRLLGFDATSLSDAGVRYAFRLAFLRRTAQGYASAGLAEGFSNYDTDDKGAPRLIAKDGRVRLRSLDAPRAFFVSNPEALLRREEVWDANGPSARRVGTRLLDPDVRAADDWLAKHPGTRLGRSFVVKKANGMVDALRRGKGWVEMDFDRTTIRFDLAVSAEKNVVRKVTVK